MTWTNYHTHTTFCDGIESPIQFAESAMKKGLKVLGFSSHAPVPFKTSWNLPVSQLPVYCKTINNLKGEFEDRLEILLGLEIDFIPGLIGPNKPYFNNIGLDYRIGSVHFIGQLNNGTYWEIDNRRTFIQGFHEIFDCNIKKLVKEYYHRVRLMIENDCPDIIGHFDVVKKNNGDNTYFTEDEEWYREEVYKTLKVLANSSAILELNTNGIAKGILKAPYPSEWIIERCYDLNIPVMINSDAHKSDNLIFWFENAAALLLDIGYNKLRVLDKGGWRSCSFTTQGIDL
ncbi:MAG: histidinol-phosphatase [Candidatus Hatepunaea meridiana]|nr:histidinol-phosphatase [Candidatus Hatepunaea meridiana]